jgi:hypothetical protein
MYPLWVHVRYWQPLRYSRTYPKSIPYDNTCHKKRIKPAMQLSQKWNDIYPI